MEVPQSRVVIIEGIYALSARIRCAPPGFAAWSALSGGRKGANIRRASCLSFKRGLQALMMLQSAHSGAQGSCTYGCASWHPSRCTNRPSSPSPDLMRM